MTLQYLIPVTYSEMRINLMDLWIAHIYISAIPNPRNPLAESSFHTTNENPPTKWVKTTYVTGQSPGTSHLLSPSRTYDGPSLL